MMRILIRVILSGFLVVYLAIAVLWIRSYAIMDTVEIVRTSNICGVNSDRGRLLIISVTGGPPNQEAGTSYSTSKPDTPPISTDSFKKLFPGLAIRNTDNQFISSVMVLIDYWLVFGVFTCIMLGVFLPYWIRSRRKQASEGCPECGYDTRGIATKCPECGTALTHKISPQTE